MRLTGSGFTTAVPTVLVGGNPATDVVVLSDTALDCVTPAGTAGAATVAVSNLHGSCVKEAVLRGAFEYTKGA